MDAEKTSFFHLLPSFFLFEILSSSAGKGRLYYCLAIASRWWSGVTEKLTFFSDIIMCSFVLWLCV